MPCHDSHSAMLANYHAPHFDRSGQISHWGIRGDPRGLSGTMVRFLRTHRGPESWFVNEDKEVKVKTQWHKRCSITWIEFMVTYDVLTWHGYDRDTDFTYKWNIRCDTIWYVFFFEVFLQSYNDSYKSEMLWYWRWLFEKVTESISLPFVIEGDSNVYLFEFLCLLRAFGVFLSSMMLCSLTASLLFQWRIMWLLTLPEVTIWSSVIIFLCCFLIVVPFLI